MSLKFALTIKSSTADPRSEAPIDDGLFAEGKNGKTLLLIHGMTGAPHEMRALSTFFSRQGYTVICPRLANHGLPLSILKKTTWEMMYGSVREAFLKHCRGRRPVFAAGLSMGALLALNLADEFPGEVTAVSCLSPTLFYDGWNIPWIKNLLPIVSYTPLKNFLYFKESPPYGIKNEIVRARVHRSYQNADLHDAKNVALLGYPYFPVSLLCELQRLVKNLTKRLPCITTPTQLIQAQDDDMTSVKNSEFIYERIGAREKELVLLYDSYHVITADQERRKVSEKMFSFFERFVPAKVIA